MINKKDKTMSFRYMHAMTHDPKRRITAATDHYFTVSVISPVMYRYTSIAVSLCAMENFNLKKAHF